MSNLHFLEKFEEVLAAEAAEDVLKGLFTIMKLNFEFSLEFRKNIENFTGKYQFRSKDGDFGVVVEFADGAMHVHGALDDDVNATVIFKDGKSLLNFLLSKDKDILRGLLDNEIRALGNLNYIYKLAFMATHMELEFKGDLPG